MTVHKGGNAVVHPPHYNADPSGVECIEVARHRNFNIGSVFKYIWRAGLKVDLDKDEKASELQDLRKAKWYLEDEIARLSGQPKPEEYPATYLDVAEWLESGESPTQGNSLLVQRILEKFAPKEKS